jgi:hypothetical protein
VDLRLSTQGIVARKGDTAIRLETERKVLAVQGPTAKESFDALSELERWIDREQGIKSAEIATYYEISSSGLVKAGKSARAIFTKHYPRTSPLMLEVRNAIGIDLDIFGVSLASAGQLPNQENWCDIRIRPHLPEGNSRFAFELIFRDKNRPKFAEFIQNHDRYITSLVKVIEES